jgi:hypothetical protein
MSIEMIFEIAKEMDWPITDTLAKLEMNGFELSLDARKLGEVMGVFTPDPEFDY